MVANARPDKGAEIWLINTAKKNFWRVATWYDLKDLINDGYLCYYTVIERYPHATEPEHIMSLFKRTYINHITDLANRSSRQVDCIEACLNFTEESQINAFIESYACDFSSLLQTILEAPQVVAEAIKAYIADPDIFAPLESYADRTRETNNARLCKRTGRDVPDLRELVRNYLRTRKTKVCYN